MVAVNLIIGVKACLGMSLYRTSPHRQLTLQLHFKHRLICIRTDFFPRFIDDFSPCELIQPSRVTMGYFF